MVGGMRGEIGDFVGCLWLFVCYCSYVNIVYSASYATNLEASTHRPTPHKHLLPQTQHFGN